IKGYQVEGSQRIKTAEDSSEAYNIYEVIIPVGSPLAEGTLKSMRFNRTYNMAVLAIRQRGDVLLDKLTSIHLKEGDMLLVLGSKAELQNLENQKLVVTLSEYEKKKT